MPTAVENSPDANGLINLLLPAVRVAEAELANLLLPAVRQAASALGTSLSYDLTSAGLGSPGGQPGFLLPAVSQPFGAGDPLQWLGANANVGGAVSDAIPTTPHSF